MRRLRRNAVLLPPVCRSWGIAAFVLLQVMVAGRAQGSSIRGVIRDADGGVVAGVAITVRNVLTGVARRALTDASGFYAVPLLQPGHYSLRSSKTGFETQTTDLVLDSGLVVRQDFQLVVGAPSNVIDVTSSANRLQTTAQDVGLVIESKQIHELPLIHRNYLDLVTLSPGVVRGAQAGRGEITSIEEEGGFRAGVLAMDQNAILVDGIDNAARTIAGPLRTQAQTMKPTVEAIAEVRVIRSNISAEYGYKGGAQILVSTRSGTNRLHGSLYSFHRNGALTANNFMFNRDSPRDGETNELIVPPPPYLRNQFGGAVGGPIVRDRTFFFFSLQATRLRTTAGSYLVPVPSPLARQGDFSRESQVGAGRSPDLFDPLTLAGSGPDAERRPFAGNVVPRSRWDPATAALLELYPMPNLPGLEFESNNYFRAQPNHTSSEVFDFRVDHNFNDRHRMFGRFSLRDEVVSEGGELPFPAQTALTRVSQGQQVALNYSAALGSRIHNELRGGFTHFPAMSSDQYTENLNEKFGIRAAAVDQFPDLIPDELKQGFTYTVLARYVNLGNLGIVGARNGTWFNTLSATDNLLIDRGNHSLKLGAEYRRWGSKRSQGNIFGTLLFDGRYTARYPNRGSSRAATGNSLADFLLGWSRGSYNELAYGEQIAAPYWGLYFQDDWRVTPRLTINLGLRWELFGGARHVSFDPTTVVAKPTFSGNLFDETRDTLDIGFEKWVFPAGPGDCGCRLDKNDWSPRLGIAYRLHRNTVLRAGAGLYYSEQGTVVVDSNRFLPGGPNPVWRSTAEDYEKTSLVVSEDGFPPLSIEGGDPGVLRSSGVSITPDFVQTPYNSQWFFDIQHQLPWEVLVTLGYNGTSAHRLAWSRNVADPLEPGAESRLDRLRTPAPTGAGGNGFEQQVRGLIINDNVLNANYHAFTAKLEKRWSDGLSFLGSFTWSKGIDYGRASRNEHSEPSGVRVSSYPGDLWRNRGPSALSRDFAGSASFLYELPAGPGRGRWESGPASWVLGGWQVGGILSLQSGPWIAHRFSPNTQNNGGVYRGDLVGELNLPEAERDSMRWFNPSAVVAGPEGEFGTAGRNLIEGPGFKNFDLLLSKFFQMPWEGHRVQFRFEAFNLTNTPHLGPPTSRTGTVSDSDLSHPDAARILSADAPRIIQFALKYVF